MKEKVVSWLLLMLYGLALATLASCDFGIASRQAWMRVVVGVGGLAAITQAYRPHTFKTMIDYYVNKLQIVAGLWLVTISLLEKW